VSRYSTNEIDLCLITNSDKMSWYSTVVACQVLIPRIYHRLPNNKLARFLHYLIRIIKSRESTLLDPFSQLLLLLEGWLIRRPVLPHVPPTTASLWQPRGWSSRRWIGLPHPSTSICHGDPPQDLDVSRFLLASQPDVTRPAQRDWLPQKSLIPTHRVRVFGVDSTLHQILPDPHQAAAAMHWLRRPGSL
jgi:hypothetical protein